MKNINRTSGTLLWRSIKPVLAAAAVALWACPVCAGVTLDTELNSYTLGFDIGEATTTPGGIGHAVGMSGSAIFLSPNPLITGLHLMEGRAVVDKEGNFVAEGTSTVIVGTWDLKDPANPKFTPSPGGGIWVATWHGSGSFVDGSQVMQATGRGIAGEVKGMQLQGRGSGTLLVTHYDERLLDPHASK